jgi:exodeoxyribonuclease III
VVGGARRRRELPVVVRVITLNVNGIRSAAKKGLFGWLSRQQADVVCLQEVKAQQADLDAAVHGLKGYTAQHCSARKKGYSGVALYSRLAPERVKRGFGVREFDDEGRYLEAQFAGLAVISVYLPSGSSSAQRLQAKFRFLEAFLRHLKKLSRAGRELILCGDWNIAHREIDLRNWRSNRNHPGFLPEERAWLSRVFGEAGYVDVFRRVEPRPGQYTWWSNRGKAWAKNVGWRIDYQIATPGVAQSARRAAIYKAKRFSDHAPLTVDYEWKLG